MTLKEYLERNSIKVGEFADLINVDRVSVSRYLSGSKPSSTIMERIASVTDGAVTPNDFFNVELRAS